GILDRIAEGAVVVGGHLAIARTGRVRCAADREGGGLGRSAHQQGGPDGHPGARRERPAGPRRTILLMPASLLRTPALTLAHLCPPLFGREVSPDPMGRPGGSQPDVTRAAPAPPPGVSSKGLSWLDGSQGTNRWRECTAWARSSPLPTATWARRSTTRSASPL